MQRIADVEQELSTINRDMGVLFRQTVPALASLDAESLDRWAACALEIATGGWHAFESASAFIRLSPALLSAEGTAALLQCGHYGTGLSGFSFEPGTTYFRGISQLLDADRFETAGAIEVAGEAIRARYANASNLLADFFRIGFDIAVAHPEEAVQSWSGIACAMVAMERTDLTRFLAATDAAGTIDWSYVRALSEHSSAAALDFLAAWPRLSRWLSADQRQTMSMIAMAYALRPAELAIWLETLAATLPQLAPAPRGLLLQLLQQIPGLALARSLMAAASRLPLDRPAIIHAWVAHIDDYLPLNVEAACGYLGLESAKSVQVLERLLGQVNFDDCKRVLQLYTEAVTGRRLGLEACADELPPMPSTDGRSIYLPATIHRYPESADNFSLFKISLLHQLGYFEFGTFTYAPGGSAVPFRAFFRSFANPVLARSIFQILEDARVDWALTRRYRGARSALGRFKRDALAGLHEPASTVGKFLSALLRLSLDGEGRLTDTPAGALAVLQDHVRTLDDPAADVYRTMVVLRACYSVIEQAADREAANEADLPEDLRLLEMQAEPVAFRGSLEPDRARVNMQLARLEDQDVQVDEDGKDEAMALSGMPDPKDMTIDQLKKGDVEAAMAMMITDLDGRDVDGEQADRGTEDGKGELADLLQELIKPRAMTFQYDEWDWVIADYRRRWCTLYEIREVEEKPEFVEDTLRELRGVRNQVRRQLGNLKPELLRKVKGVVDGEELDIERTIESIVDKRAGYSPDDRIYVQRQRKDRDVSTLFLLDMSASTDDRISPPELPAEQVQDGDADGSQYDDDGAKMEVDTRKRIIDLEKEAVVLMAEALEDLGDSYAVCGFSGYGKDQVDFYLCKDFQEPYSRRAKGRIGGIKPCRSTRMGPAIRHATKKLVATEARIKALIILSDGYPQDFDYGKDRNSRDYGIKDTTMALTEARQKGVQAFCLTVDPSGHDYLREMCPDQQYMVIQDINQLPQELSRVYRSMTA